jgi:hypothetical protein
MGGVVPLRKQLLEARVECPKGGEVFMVPCCMQARLITETAVIQEIESFEVPFGREKAALHAKRICQSARRLFCTLVYMRKSPHIFGFLDEGVADLDLPLTRKLDDEREFIMERSAGGIVQTLEKWRPRSREKFCITQRLMTAPVFETGEHYDLCDNTVLPFVTFPKDDSTADHRGGYSEILFRRIHPSHHTFWESSETEVGCPREPTLLDNWLTASSTIDSSP